MNKGIFSNQKGKISAPEVSPEPFFLPPNVHHIFTMVLTTPDSPSSLGDLLATPSDSKGKSILVV
jgi:hypothetical protein